MSSTITAVARRHRRFLLASNFLAPLLSLGTSGALAQTPPSDQLPPIEVSAPTDQNRTRAKPTYDEGSGARRVAPNPTPSGNRNPAPGAGANTASQGDGQGGGGTPVRQFAG